MIFKPHPYQARAIQHIIDNPACSLFLEMGLGKTVSTLTALDELMYNYGSVTPGTILVIGPKKVVESVWVQEAAKWDHLKHLKVIRITGDRKARLKALATKGHIYLISRDNVDWLVKHWGKKWPYKVVALDELSSFKNPQSIRFRQLRKVRPLSTRVIGLTGTPSPNGLQDLWSQMYLLDRGERLEKTVGAFRDHYLKPLSTDGGYVVYKWGLKAGAEEKIHAAIADICISMKAEDYLDLPDRLDITEPVELDGPAVAMMRQLQMDLVLNLEEGDLVAETAASLSGKLTQMASGAVYSTPVRGEPRTWIHIHDAKLDALAELLEAQEATGDNTLVFYWHQHMLERLKARFPGARELKTEQDVADWNAGEIPLLLAHPASAGHGLNLQDGGSVIVWAELTWSLELYLQANARLHRQGQLKPVRVYHLVATGTIDEDIVAALAAKDVSQNKLMEAVKVRLEI